MNTGLSFHPLLSFFIQLYYIEIQMRVDMAPIGLILPLCMLKHGVWPAAHVTDTPPSNHEQNNRRILSPDISGCPPDTSDVPQSIEVSIPLHKHQLEDYPQFNLTLLSICNVTIFHMHINFQDPKHYRCNFLCSKLYYIYIFHFLGVVTDE